MPKANGTRSEFILGLALFAVAILSFQCRAQSELGARFALVVGNGAYRTVPALANPPNDANAVAQKLRNLGFTTELLLDADRASMQLAVDHLSQAAQGAEAAVLFYAGHATELSGSNILIPVSARLRNADDLRREGISLNAIMEELGGKAKSTVIFLDACRDSPYTQMVAVNQQSPSTEGSDDTRSLGGRGLAPVGTSSGTLVAFATAPGQVALDGNSDHSPFTAALLRHISDQDVDVQEMLTRVRRDVRMATESRQIPWDNSSLESEFYFSGASGFHPQVMGTIYQEAAKYNISIPAVLGAFESGTGPDARFVGAWSSGEEGWNRTGRRVMLLVLSVNEATGTADVVFAVGPPVVNGGTYAATRETVSSYRHVLVHIKNGMLLLDSNAANTSQTFQLLSDDSILATDIVPQSWADNPGRRATVVLHRIR